MSRRLVFRRKTCRADARSRDPAKLRELIQELTPKYSISAICNLLHINRSKYYYKPRRREIDPQIEHEVLHCFKESGNNYGTRRIKQVLHQKGYQVSRRKIGQIMRKHNLASNYTKKRYKPAQNGCNESSIPNLLSRKFRQSTPLAAVVSDLTYVRVGEKWCYICLITDLWNREIIGWSVGEHKDALLVQEALYSIPYALDQIGLFHTDRGKEFDNKLIDDVLDTFQIRRSLSKKGCPHDNAVIESTNKTLKTEFIYQQGFDSVASLRTKLSCYIHWYNHERLHSSLGYQTPASQHLKSTLTLFYTTTLFYCCKKG